MKRIILPFKIIFLLLFLIILFSSLLNLYEKKDAIKFKVFKFLNISEKNNDAYKTFIPEKDKYWAKKIMQGGYILHFRHAERNKWIDVEMYDALESDVHNNGINESRYAENDYFDQAVCLNKRGKIQAKAMGEHLNNINFPIGYVASSPSCRARQTAKISFKGYDSLHRILVHTGPYNETRLDRKEKLINFFKNLKMIKNKNTIVSAHNSVVICEMFINMKCPSKIELEEGGFYVINKTSEGLVLEYEFHTFNEFIKVFYKR